MNRLSRENQVLFTAKEKKTLGLDGNPPTFSLHPSSVHMTVSGNLRLRFIKF